jgi:hypothetical protein
MYLFIIQVNNQINKDLNIFLQIKQVLYDRCIRY